MKEAHQTKYVVAVSVSKKRNSEPKNIERKTENRRMSVQGVGVNKIHTNNVNYIDNGVAEIE